MYLAPILEQTPRTETKFSTTSEFGAPGENCHDKNCAGNEKKEDGDALLADSKKKHHNGVRKQMDLEWKTEWMIVV